MNRVELMRAKIQAFVSGEGMKARTIQSTFLSMLGAGGALVIRLVSNLILTRLLFPEAFGLMALVFVFITGLQMFSDIGLRQSIIQNKRGDERKFLDTAWTIQIVRGFILWIMAFSLSGFVADFYEQEQLRELIPVLALQVVILGFASTNLVEANRNLNLKPEVFLALISQFMAAVLMIVLAYFLQSVWALVFGTLFGATSKTILSHLVFAKTRNRLGFDTAAFWEIFHFGKYLFVATIAGYFVNQGDRMVLGKFITLETLAIFTIAFFLAFVPIKLHMQLFSKVVFPLLCRRPPWESTNNRQQIRLVFAGAVSAFFAISAVTAIIGEWVVEFLYDPRYHGAGPMLVLLSLANLPFLLTAGYKQLLLSTGDSRTFTALTIVSAVIRMGLLVWLISDYGVLGAILAPFLTEIFTYPLLIYFIRKTKGWYRSTDFLAFAVMAGLCALALWLSPAALDMLSVLWS